MPSVVNFPFGGMGPVGHKTGLYYPNPLYASDTTDVTVTATRIHYTPYYFNEIRSYAGIVFRNNGAGDSGKKVRTGVYTNVNGQPGALLVACAEATLAGAAADNVCAGAFTPTYIGWHWIALQSDTTPALKRMSGINGNVTGNFLPALTYPGLFGVFAASGDAGGFHSYHYVDTTYAALASTAVAPTATGSPPPWVAVKA